MKKDRAVNYTEIKFVSENRQKDMQEYITKYNKGMRKKSAIFSSLINFLRYTIYIPIAIATNIISVAFKIGGSIAAIGIPYGIYCAYVTVKAMYSGISLGDIKQTTFVCLFLIFPFIAFALSFVFEKVTDYLTYHK